MADNTLEQSLRAKINAGEPIGVGIVGLGASTNSWAERTHVPAIQALPGFELRGASSSSLASAKVAAARHNLPFMFETPAEMAQHEAIDMVVISVRVPLHAATIEQVIGSGKVIFSEWPLGIDTAEAKALTAKAESLGVRTVVGMQSRFNPAIAFLHDLVAEGYVGDVLSSSIIGSGGLYGTTITNQYEYLLDERNGANMRTIGIGHVMEALAWVLGEPSHLRMEQATQRKTSFNIESEAEVPVTSADQIWFSGRTGTGAILTGHYRGGLWLSSNLYWEILGTKGELKITGTNGSLQTQAVQIAGAQSGETELTDLPVPDAYTTIPGLDPVAQRTALVAAHAYLQLEQDLRNGISKTPSWADAVRRHESIDLTKN